MAGDPQANCYCRHFSLMRPLTGAGLLSPTVAAGDLGGEWEQLPAGPHINLSSSPLDFEIHDRSTATTNYFIYWVAVSRAMPDESNLRLSLHDR